MTAYEAATTTPVRAPVSSRLPGQSTMMTTAQTEPGAAAAWPYGGVASGPIQESLIRGNEPLTLISAPFCADFSGHGIFPAQ
jgi:hypothetical protein